MNKNKTCIAFPFHFIIIISICTSCIEMIVLGEEDMSVVSAAITGGIGAVSVIAAALIGAKVTRKNQLDKNTDAVNKLIDDVGRGDRESLSRQHESISRTVSEAFGRIQSRYDKEDEAYRAFSREQISLKNTMDSFVKDYSSIINEVEWYKTQEIQDKELIEELTKENTKLRSEIEECRKSLIQKEVKIEELEEYRKAIERSVNDDYAHEDFER